MVEENQIIEECKKGKHKSFGMLYKKYAPLMLGVCFRYSKTKDEAEDVLQEGFIKVFQKIKSFEGKGSFEGWMRRIMVNTAINNYKANNKHYYHDDIDQDNNINLKVDELLPFEVDDNISKNQIVKLIQELPAGYQMVFNLYVIEGLTHQEIADELEVSINTSKSQLSKARKWLRNKILENKKMNSYS
ncbi:MAG: sigma-70 family RNA polymerase sigma factor [Bacteroidota bacterium]